MSPYVLVAVMVALIGCAGLAVVPHHSVREVFFATLAMAGTLAIPIVAWLS